MSTPPDQEEWVDRSEGKRPRRRHPRPSGRLGFTGDRAWTTRRAVAAVKAAWRGQRPHLPAVDHRARAVAAVDWGEGPKVLGPDGRARGRCCSARGWRGRGYSVVIPTWGPEPAGRWWRAWTPPSAPGRVPSYVLTDNARTVTIDHVAGAGAPPRPGDRGQELRHDGPHVRVPYDPQSAGRGPRPRSR